MTYNFTSTTDHVLNKQINWKNWNGFPNNHRVPQATPQIRDSEPDVFTPSTPTAVETKVEKNKGFINKVKHLFTGKDYYKTSTGVKVKTDKNTGRVYEAADGTVYIEGAQNAEIKGTKKDDNIVVSESSIDTVKAKRGNDNIEVRNSTVKTVKGNGGKDTIIINNSYADNVNGGCAADNIYTVNSNVSLINGSWGKDTIETSGGYTEEVKSTSRDTVEIKNNPLNRNPNADFAF